MSEHDDPLWNPDAPADADLAAIQRQLAPLGWRTRHRDVPRIPARRRRPGRWLGWAAAASVALLVASALQFRLAWREGDAWSVTQEEAGQATAWHWQPGESFATAPGQTASVAVARIGRLELSPDTRVRLLRTGPGRHRVALEHGHVRARIWAPPGFFGIATGAAEVVDLGCDFDVWRDADGSGRLQVRSGWVSYRVGDQDVLVPEGHGLDIADDVASTPLRLDATAGLRRAVQALDAAQDAAARDEVLAPLADAVARSARDSDAFTLLSLMTRHPTLADTELYPRLAVALRVGEIPDGHRQAWRTGDQAAIDAWWRKLPRQPKHWWGNWTDLVGAGG